jgi:hypothetical protein
MSAPSYESGRDDGFLSTHGSLVKQKAVFDLHLYIIELDPREISFQHESIVHFIEIYRWIPAAHLTAKPKADESSRRKGAPFRARHKLETKLGD